MAEQAFSIKNLSLGGIADSKWHGSENSAAEIIGVDLHSKPGVMMVNQKMATDTNALIDDFVRVQVPCSNGKTYFFGSTNGKIWSRTSAGVWTLEATVAVSTGGAGIINALEYSGYLYYATAHFVGRWEINSDWTTSVDEYGAFEIGDPDFHPMVIASANLWIGDGNYIASVGYDPTTLDHSFIPNGTVIKNSSVRVKCLGTKDGYLLIGGFNEFNPNLTDFRVWNMWSTNFDMIDPVEEQGINAIITAGNNVFVNAGLSGRFYVYSNGRLEPYRQMPGDFSPTKTALIYENAWAQFRGRPIFGWSNNEGNPLKQGVYSLGSYSPSYPAVLNFDWPISLRDEGEYVFDDIEIGAVSVVGDEVIISWRHSSDSVTYGVDVLDYTQRLEKGIIESRVHVKDDILLNKYDTITCNYYRLPEGTDIEFSHKLNHATDWTAYPNSVNDEKRMQVKIDQTLNARIMELKIEMQTTGNETPEIEGAFIGVN